MNKKCCAECGSTDIHYPIYKDVNTGEISGDLGEVYCCNCGGSVNIVTVKKFTKIKILIPISNDEIL